MLANITRRRDGLFGLHNLAKWSVVRPVGGFFPDDMATAVTIIYVVYLWLATKPILTRGMNGSEDHIFRDTW